MSGPSNETNVIHHLDPTQSGNGISRIRDSEYTTKGRRWRIKWGIGNPSSGTMTSHVMILAWLVRQRNVHETMKNPDSQSTSSCLCREITWLHLPTFYTPALISYTPTLFDSPPLNRMCTIPPYTPALNPYTTRTIRLTLHRMKWTRDERKREKK